MKKRLLSYILIMVMLFVATVPSFAAQDVSVSSFYNASSGVGINAGQLMQSLLNSIVAINSKLPAVTSTGTVFENIDTRLGHIESWLVPENSAGTNPSLYQLILELGIAAQSYLPYIPTISNYVGNWMTTNNNYLNHLNQSLFAYDSSLGYSKSQFVYRNLHRQLLDDTAYKNYINNVWSAPFYYQKSISDNGLNSIHEINWNSGSPLGNIALILRNFNDNFVNSYSYRWNADLKHYNDKLTTWKTVYDGDAKEFLLVQEEFQPESAIQGLYHYLAFIQKDTAKLAHQLSDENRILLQNKTQEDTGGLLKNFYGGSQDNSPSTQNWADVGSIGTNIKTNMNTGANASGIFDLFTGDHTSAWFSQETANELNNTGSGSRSLKASAPQPVYETPLLDNQVNEIMSIFGGGQ